MRPLNAMLLLIVVQTGVTAADLTADQQLVDACYRLSEFRVIQLLRGGANPNSRFGKPPIGGSIRSDWTPLLALANSPAQPARNSTMTPQTVHSKRLAILRLLLSHGCNVDSEDRDGHTALHASIKNRHADFCEFLLLFNPNVNTIASEGHMDYESPLHSAYWSSILMQHLIAAGADEDKKDSLGNTAAQARNLKMFSDFMHAHDRVPTAEECARLGLQSPFAVPAADAP